MIDTMPLPLPTHYAPMEAVTVDEIPIGDEWQYEPKWDGFRCLAFRDGDDIALQSKSSRALTRYFPELVDALRQLKARHFVIDAEIVVTGDGSLSFDLLLQRIHPAPSRIRKLADETPARMIIFDLLVDSDGRLLATQALSMRRAALEAFFTRFATSSPLLRLSPMSTRPQDAQRWLAGSGSALDGVIAKRRDLGYQSDNRTGMQKIKNYRSADCVVGGFRYGEGKSVVGSLLLGLYDHEGHLNHVGFTSSIRSAEKPSLTTKLEKLIAPPGFTGKAPGGPSRWSTRRTSEWQPVRPELVVEVSYDHFSGGRFRHGTRLLRWRPDKSPKQCTLQQVQGKRPDLSKLLA